MTLAATLVMAAGLAAAGALLVSSLHGNLIDSLDETAHSRVDNLAAMVRRGDTGGPLAASPADTTTAQIVGADGRVLASSPGLDADAPLAQPGPAGTGPADRIIAHMTIDDRDFRAATRTVDTPSGPVTIVVASPLTDIHQAEQRVTTAAALGGPVLLALLAAATWTLARYTLRTVERLRGQVAVITATDLHRRVDVPPARDDIQRLALTMNGMLARLEEASKAQRRFLADAAHELRSPLAALRTQLDVAHRTADPTHWHSRAPRMISDADRLAALVEGLLILARLDENPRPTRREPIDLDEIVLTHAALLRAEGPPTIDTRAVSAGLVAGDATLLTRVVRNLLENALRHARTRVEVRLTTDDGRVELVVADDGPGIPQAARQRVFDRFHRLDPSRGRDAGGSGLGLAIVRDAVTAHDGTVHIGDNHPGARLIVWLPAHPPP